MLRTLIFATLVAVLPGAASGQALGVLHIKVTLTDAGRVLTPVAGHALLISDNPATSTPRRVVTAQDGAVDVRLPPGNYTVESDEPVEFGGKGYQWTQTLDIGAGRDVVLELTTANAEVGAAPAPRPSPSAPRRVDDSPLLLSRWKDGVVTVWTPASRASGFVVGTAGLVLTTQRVVGSATAVDVQLTPAVKVAARVLVADNARDVAVLWIDPAIAALVRPAPLNCTDTSTRGVALSDDRTVPFDEVCEVVRSAEKATQTAQPPAATLLPVEPLRPYPDGALDEAVKRRAGSLSPYQLSASDFDVAFLTPVLVRGAQQGSQAAIADFGEWRDYFADGPPVVLVRVLPKQAEGFWTTVARGAAYTQGVALPAIKHFKPGFLRLQAFCGDAEVTPIHPFTFEKRISETEGARGGLYVFDPGALGPHCTSVKLVLYSEKDPKKQDAITVDRQVIDRIWQDFASYRALAAAP